jgi:hypothetical protein
MRFSRFPSFFALPILCLLVLFALVICPTVSAQDAAAPTQTGIDWGALAGNGLLTILQAIGASIAAGLAVGLLWVCRAVAKKFNIQMSAEQDRQVYTAADKAVAAAEEWARQQAQKPLGNQKAQVALDALRDVLDSKTYKEYGEPALKKLIDSAVAKFRAEQAAVEEDVPETATPA